MYKTLASFKKIIHLDILLYHIANYFYHIAYYFSFYVKKINEGVQFLEKSYMQFKWLYKNKPRTVSTEMQMKQKQNKNKNNYELTCTNLKILMPPEGSGNILVQVRSGRSLKR